jgi:hypothetical protein
VTFSSAQHGKKELMKKKSFSLWRRTAFRLCFEESINNRQSLGLCSSSSPLQFPNADSVERITIHGK